MLDGSMDQRLEKDNSVHSWVIKVREFIFMDRDYKVLSEFREQMTAYVVFGQNYLNFTYIKAESNASNHLNSDMKDGITSMVNKFAPSIIDQYGATTWLLWLCEHRGLRTADNIVVMRVWKVGRSRKRGDPA